MDTETAIRSKFSKALLLIGTVLVLLGVLSNSLWAFLGAVIGLGLWLTGAVMFTSVFVVSGVPWLAKLASRHAEDEWDGELVHGEGSGLKVRYAFDHQGNPWFVAKDVCIAIGVKPPKKDDLKCGAFPILKHGDLMCLSEANVQAYLTSLAMSNHTANRLLVNIRSNVLRKLEKQRDDKRRYG